MTESRTNNDYWFEISKEAILRKSLAVRRIYNKLKNKRRKAYRTRHPPV